MIKTVIFDLGGVIVPLDFAAGYKRLESVCPFEASEIPHRIRSTDIVVQFESGKIAPDEFYRRLSEILKMDVSFDDFKDLWCGIFPPHSLIPAVWIEQIRRERRVLLLSNTNQIHFDLICQRYSHLAHFDSYVLSYQVGAMKPHASIYEEAIARAGCLPDECFFTDDILPYVEGARSLGIDAVQFQGSDKLRRDLAERGIMVD
jgi:putative hydrolase of the HAD superfamily